MSKTTLKSRFGWHFSLGKNSRGDGRKIAEGITHDAQHNGQPVKQVVLCGPGLHASPTPAAAWRYASHKWTTLSFVKVSGRTIPHDDTKFCGMKREYLKVIKLDRKDRDIIHKFYDIGEYDKLNKHVYKLFGLM